MAEQAQNFPKVQIAAMRSAFEDVQNRDRWLERIEDVDKLWARIDSVDPDYYDKYSISVFASLNKLVVDNDSLRYGVEAYSADAYRYKPFDIVKVLWTPENDFALIAERSMFGWFRLSKDWEPNEYYLQGRDCDRNGNYPIGEPEININLLTSSYPVAYCPFKKDQVISYIHWPFQVPSSWDQRFTMMSGFVWAYPQMPLPSGLHQVLTCWSYTETGKSQIGWNYVRARDRQIDPQASPPFIP